MSASLSASDAEQFLRTSFVELIKFENGNVTADGGSGCLIDFADKNYLLTVEHNMAKNESRLFLRCEPGIGSLLKPLPKENGAKVRKLDVETIGSFLADLDDPSLRSMDLTYFDFDPLECGIPEITTITADGESMEVRQCRIYTENDFRTPSKRHFYGFGGMAAGKLIAGTGGISGRVTEFRWCYGLTYEGQQGDFYLFKLPFKHPGNGYYKGVSGAPIVDLEGNVVALVSNGVPKFDLILGVPIKTYLLTLMGPYLVRHQRETGSNYLPEHLRTLFADL